MSCDSAVKLKPTVWLKQNGLYELEANDEAEADSDGESEADTQDGSANREGQCSGLGMRCVLGGVASVTYMIYNNYKHHIVCRSGLG